MDSADAYEIIAHDFLRSRDSSLIGTQIVDQWAQNLPTGSTVIELACGGGYPISSALEAAGLQLWAMDSSPSLVAAFRSRLPHIPVQCEKVQDSDFFGRLYDGAIAIGLLFLLSQVDQTNLISRVAEILRPNGRFLFTAPIEAGRWKDLNTGLECSSLGRERYVELLTNSGFRLVATYTDNGGNNYYDAEKTV